MVAGDADVGFASGWIRRGFGVEWRLLDGTRRLLLNLLLLALLGALLWGWLHSRPAPLADRTALVLQLRGPLVEQTSGSWRDAALFRVRGDDLTQVQLRDLLAVLDAAAKDARITQALLLLDEFQGAGPASLREVAAESQKTDPVLCSGGRRPQRGNHRGNEKIGPLEISARAHHCRSHSPVNLGGLMSASSNA